MIRPLEFTCRSTFNKLVKHEEKYFPEYSAERPLVLILEIDVCCSHLNNAWKSHCKCKLITIAVPDLAFPLYSRHLFLAFFFLVR